MSGSAISTNWRNAGFATFDDYLNPPEATKRRTAVRHERGALEEQGVTIRVFAGEEIADKMFAEMFQIYLFTIEKLYGDGVLTGVSSTSFASDSSAHGPSSARTRDAN